MDLFQLFGRIGIDGADQAERDINNVTQTAEKSESRMTSAFKKIGAAVAAAFAVSKIKDFGVAIVQASAEVAAEEAAFTQIMGDYSDTAAAKVSKIAEATGMVDSRLTPYMTSMTAKFKGLGYDIDDATDLASTGLNIAADAAAFWDKSLEDSMGSLNSFVNGNYEGGEAIGLFANETTLAAWSSENLGLKWANLTEKEKQFARLQFAKAMQEASGAAGQAAKESGAYQNVMGNLTEAWRQFKAEVGEPLLQNIVIPAMKWFGDFITNTLIPKFNELKTWVSENKETLQQWGEKLLWAGGIVAGFAAAWKIGTLFVNLSTAIRNANTAIVEYIAKVYAASAAGVVSNATLSVKNILLGVLSGQIAITTAATMLWEKAQQALNKALISNPIGLIIMAIAALIALLVAAYKKNEDFRNAVNELGNTIKESLQPVIEALKPLLSAIIDLFKQIWSLISALVIPIFKAIVTALTAVVQAITPILSVLFKVFSACFTPIIKIVTTVIKLIAKIVEVIAKAVNAVKNGISKIKDIFKFKWSLPKLKLPHVKIKGKFSLSPPKVPKFSIDWYKKAMDNGMILNDATIFGMNSSGQLMGGGEAGSEAIVGTNSLTNMINSAVKAENDALANKLDDLINMLAEFFPQILGANKAVVLDSGALVGKLAPAMNSKFGDMAKANARGR